MAITEVMAITRNITQCAIFFSVLEKEFVFLAVIVMNFKLRVWVLIEYTILNTYSIINKLNLKNMCSQVISLLAVYLGAYKGKSEKEEKKSPIPCSRIHTVEEFKFG